MNDYAALEREATAPCQARTKSRGCMCLPCTIRKSIYAGYNLNVQQQERLRMGEILTLAGGKQLTWADVLERRKFNEELEFGHKIK